MVGNEEYFKGAEKDDKEMQLLAKQWEQTICSTSEEGMAIHEHATYPSTAYLSLDAALVKL